MTTMVDRVSGPVVLVTGATGFIGSTAATALTGHGAAVRALTRSPIDRPAPGGTIPVRGCLEDAPSLRPDLAHAVAVFGGDHVLTCGDAS